MRKTINALITYLEEREGLTEVRKRIIRDARHAYFMDEKQKGDDLTNLLKTIDHSPAEESDKNDMPTILKAVDKQVGGAVRRLGSEGAVRSEGCCEKCWHYDGSFFGCENPSCICHTTPANEGATSTKTQISRHSEEQYQLSEPQAEKSWEYQGEVDDCFVFRRGNNGLNLPKTALIPNLNFLLSKRDKASYARAVECVPEEQKSNFHPHDFVRGWNACREETLSALKKEFGSDNKN